MEYKNDNNNIEELIISFEQVKVLLNGIQVSETATATARGLSAVYQAEKKKVKVSFVFDMDWLFPVDRRCIARLFSEIEKNYKIPVTITEEPPIMNTVRNKLTGANMSIVGHDPEVDEILFDNYVYLRFYRSFLDQHRVDREKCKKMIRKMGDFLNFFIKATGVDMKYVEETATSFYTSHQCRSCKKLRNLSESFSTMMSLNDTYFGL